MLELGPVGLLGEDVLGNDRNADVVLVGQEEEEARRGRLELHRHVVRIGGRCFFDELTNLGAPDNLRAVVAQ